jgi:Cdc37 Hsp90 binding domain
MSSMSHDSAFARNSFAAALLYALLRDHYSVLRHAKFMTTASASVNKRITLAMLLHMRYSPPQDFLMKEGGVLFAEHAQNILLMSCLEAEMEGKHSRAELVGRQSQVMYTALLHCYYPLLINAEFVCNDKA